MPKPLTLPDDVARFAEAQVASGRYASVEEVMRASAAALEAQQRNTIGENATLDALRAAIAEGDASPDFAGNPFDSVRAELGIARRA
jgi:putative addiction module CopG family antidote